MRKGNSIMSAILSILIISAVPQTAAAKGWAIIVGIDRYHSPDITLLGGR